MLLKAGDVWHGDFIFWTLSGKSAQEPMVLGPMNRSPARKFSADPKAACLPAAQGAGRQLSGDHGHPLRRQRANPAYTSNPVRNDPVGINILGKSNGILVENCDVENYGVNMNFQALFGPVTNVTIRRNIVTDAWSSNAHAQGIYVSGVNNVTLNGNFLDHNGWNSKISGAGPTWFNHDAYISYNDTNVVVTDNVFAEAAGYGLQARSGGVVQGNVFINDPVGMSFGIVTGANTTVGGVTGSITGNVFIGGGNIGNVNEGGGMIVGNIKAGAGAVISNNIFTQSVSGASAAIALTPGQAQPNAWGSVGINDLKIENNTFYDWTLGIDVAGGQVPGGHGLTALNRLTITGNQFENLSGYAFENHSASYNSQETISGNTYYNANQWRQGDYIVKAVGSTMGSPLPFPDPNRSISTYANSIGVSGGTAGFLAKAATQTEQAFDNNFDAASVLAYFANGFGKAAPKTLPTSPVIPTPPTTPTTPTTPTPASTQSADRHSGVEIQQSARRTQVRQLQRSGLRRRRFLGRVQPN